MSDFVSHHFFFISILLCIILWAIILINTSLLFLLSCILIDLITYLPIYLFPFPFYCTHPTLYHFFFCFSCFLFLLFSYFLIFLFSYFLIFFIFSFMILSGDDPLTLVEHHQSCLFGLLLGRMDERTRTLRGTVGRYSCVCCFSSSIYAHWRYCNLIWFKLNWIELNWIVNWIELNWIELN